jgi:hypothetical protein
LSHTYCGIKEGREEAILQELGGTVLEIGGEELYYFTWKALSFQNVDEEGMVE